MGITWEVVVAAEMISGGGQDAAGGGLGFFIWNSYLGGVLAHIVVGMISIGIAGYLAAALVRLAGRRLDALARPRRDAPRSSRDQALGPTSSERLAAFELRGAARRRR